MLSVVISFVTTFVAGTNLRQNLDEIVKQCMKFGRNVDEKSQKAKKFIYEKNVQNI